MNLHPEEVLPVFSVSDYAAAIAYYVDVLSFEKTFDHGGYYGGLMRGNARLHISLARTGVNKPAGMGSVYILLASATAVDAYHEEIRAKGANITQPPQSQDYGMHDFIINDPDGNQMTFGADLENAE